MTSLSLHVVVAVSNHVNRIPSVPSGATPWPHLARVSAPSAGIGMRTSGGH